VRHLAGEELQEALELLGVAAQARRQRGRIGAVGGLEAAHVELQAVAEALDAAEHTYGVALREPAVEQLDVVPYAALDAAARIHELQRKVGGPAARAQAPLPRHRVYALDDAVLRQLRDRRHDVGV
jgi:hypothetical protein